MDYSYCYSNARRRYYDACSEITSCQNRINDLKNQRQQKINQINQLKTDIKNHEEAYEGVSQIIKSEENVNSKISDISNKTNQASSNYSSMVSSSNVINKILNDVYNNEMTSTKRTVSNIFEKLKTKKNELNAKIIDLKKQLKQAEEDLVNINNRIASTESSLQDWKRAKTNAAYDMEYYRRKMNEAV